MQQFKIFRALGLSFKAWFANFLPITVLAAVLYSPVIVWMMRLPSGSAFDEQAYLTFFTRGMYLAVGLSALVSPFITYRVIQYMNGASSSIFSSIQHGFRGVLPAVILVGVTTGVSFIPFGSIIGAIIQCIWFVAGPAAVAERLNPISALGRSATLTQNRRWGIFGLTFLMGLMIVVVLAVWLIPLFQSTDADPGALGDKLKHAAIYLTAIICIYQMFVGIVQAVTYSLLRADKDGVSTDELAKVFE